MSDAECLGILHLGSESEEFKIVSHPTEILADILGFGNIPNFRTFIWVYFLNSCFSVQLFLF